MKHPHNELRYGIWENNAPIKLVGDHEGLFESNISSCETADISPEELNDLKEEISHQIKLNQKIKPIKSQWTSLDRKYADHVEVWSQGFDDDILRLAGIETTQCKSRQCAKDTLADMISSRYPDMNIEFKEDLVAVNGIPTRIWEGYLKKVYIGLAGVFSHKKSLELTTGVVCQQLDELFFPKDGEK